MFIDNCSEDFKFNNAIPDDNVFRFRCFNIPRKNWIVTLRRICLV